MAIGAPGIISSYNWHQRKRKLLFLSGKKKISQTHHRAYFPLVSLARTGFHIALLPLQLSQSVAKENGIIMMAKTNLDSEGTILLEHTVARHLIKIRVPLSRKKGGNGSRVGNPTTSAASPNTSTGGQPLAVVHSFKRQGRT